MSSRRSSVSADHRYNFPSQNVQKRAEHVQKSVAPDLCKSCNNPVSNEEKTLFVVDAGCGNIVNVLGSVILIIRC